MDKIYQWLIDNKQELMNKFIYKMIPNNSDAEDFYQDLYLIVADKKQELLDKIYNNNEMGAYIYVIIKNNLKSRNSKYYYTYIKPLGETYEETTDYRLSEGSDGKNELLQDIENDYQRLLVKIQSWFDTRLKDNPNLFYENQIFEMYYNQENTFRGLGEILDIPPTSLFNTVTNSRTKVIKAFDKDIKNIKAKLICYYRYDSN